jgi:hypothetical protein
MKHGNLHETDIVQTSVRRSFWTHNPLVLGSSPSGPNLQHRENKGFTPNFSNRFFSRFLRWQQNGRRIVHPVEYGPDSFSHFISV